MPARLLIGAAFVFFCGAASAQTTGSISGTVRDATGSVIPDLAIIAHNVDTGAQQSAVSNGDGFYAFTTLSVGRYDIETFRAGFKPYKRSGLTIDVGTKLQIDITLELGEQSEQVTVSDTGIHVEAESTQMGDVVAGSVMTAVGLNGRAFTDLLSLQPGIVPMSTQQPDSIVMSGVTVAITPSGGLNPGNQSISGQREDANGFLVNGSDVKEEMNGGTSIIPDLDSLAEFRVLTNNFDAELGNYAGGIVNVVTKGGTNFIHGDAFEFLRNTVLDARSYFSPRRETYQQSQFGGTLGGPIKKDKLFFFGDYQGTRTIQGLPTGLITVPSLADRTGDLSDLANSFVTKNANGVSGPSTVNGSALAAQLAGTLGYPVVDGKGNPLPYYTPGCTSSSQCVFPNAIIPQRAWTPPSTNLLQYIPPPNDGPTTFSGEENERLRDDKTSLRIDESSTRWGNLSAYYFFDDYRVSNPFPSGQGGATVPGFSALNYGRAQLISLGDTKTFGNSTVNEAHFSYMRSANVVGQPSQDTGISLASQGFVIGNGQGSPGLVPLAPFQGIENLVFVGDFVMGTPITNLAQANNTFSANESLSKIIHSHTLKAGVSVSFEQVNVHPDATLNGTYLFNGYQTGSTFADYLIGAPIQFEQADSEAYYPRHKYVGWFVQDSWRAKPSLTLNYGLRVELMQYWSEKYDQVPTFNPGQQSIVYPQSFPGLVYATDPGIPHTLVPQKFRYAPRFGMAYSPKKTSGLLGKILGGSGKTSIRASYGIFNTMIQGNSIAIDEPQPPYGLSAAVFNGLFSQPYALAAGGTQTNPFPLTFPPTNARAGNPANALIPYIGVYNPQSGMTAPPPWNTYPYTENYFFSIERQLPTQLVLSLSYVGSEAHHLPVVYSNNPGNRDLCLALNQPGVVSAVNSTALTPGQPPCGPGGENNVFTLAESFTFGGITYPAGTSLQGTRIGLNTSLVNDAVSGNFYGNDDYLASIGNSNYNALQISVKSSTKRLTYSLSYTYSKSIDQASSISDTLDPFNFEATRALSAWNLTHDFVATYDFRLPLELLSHRGRTLLEGWELSGITRASTGFPVTLSTTGDKSLQGSSPNGVNNRFLDVPDVTGALLSINPNPRNGLFYFNSAAFTDNALGTIGNASRRYFSGPGMFNTDLALLRNFQIRESKALQFRLETFNLFNQAQFFGPAAVNGNVDSTLFGQVVNAAAPRLMQVALKYTF
jgi:Carboxypeptidase regulatory-like domain